MSARRAAVLVVLVLAMFALKRHYSTAEVEDLRWILGPTSALVARASGTAFEFERGAGYLSREHFFVIEKSCAGVNFMIAALGMVGFGLSREAGSLGRDASIVARSVALGFAAAVLVNALRILVALGLSSVDPGWGWWTAARIHRLEGVVVYFGGLLALHRLARVSR
jgi:exosortase K